MTRYEYRDSTQSPNHLEHNISDVHIGLPRNSAGWLVYIPSTGCVLVSCDVVFDEDFLSTVSYTQSHVPRGLLRQPPSYPSFSLTQDVKTTELLDNTLPMMIALVLLMFKTLLMFLLVHLTILSRFPWKNISLTAYSLWLKGRSPQLLHLLLPNHCHPPVVVFDVPNVLKLFTNCIISRNLNKYILTLLNLCDIVFKLKSTILMNPSDVLPTPEHWRQILHLPERVKQAWLNAMYRKLHLLIIKKNCFKPALPNADDPIIPISTLKFRAKIRSDGLIDKLKA